MIIVDSEGMGGREDGDGTYFAGRDVGDVTEVEDGGVDGVEGRGGVVDREGRGHGQGCEKREIGIEELHGDCRPN